MSLLYSRKMQILSISCLWLKHSLKRSLIYRKYEQIGLLGVFRLYCSISVNQRSLMKEMGHCHELNCLTKIYELNLWNEWSLQWTLGEILQITSLFHKIHKFSIIYFVPSSDPHCIFILFVYRQIGNVKTSKLCT